MFVSLCVKLNALLKSMMIVEEVRLFPHGETFIVKDCGTTCIVV
jgi:hypothetical protein